MDDEMEMDLDMDDEDMDMDDEDMEFDMDYEDMDVDDEETIDLTNASDEEVLRVFKAMGDEDGIVVKKEGGNVHFKDGDNEYMIQLRESEMEDELYEMDDDLDLNEMEDDDVEMEETIYEIEMEDEDDAEMGEGWSWGGAATGAIKGGLGLDEEEEMDMEFDLYEEEDMDMDFEMDEEEEMDIDMEAVMEAVKKAIKPKGVGIGHGPKFNYDKKPNIDGGLD